MPLCIKLKILDIINNTIVFYNQKYCVKIHYHIIIEYSNSELIIYASICTFFWVKLWIYHPL